MAIIGAGFSGLGLNTIGPARTKVKHLYTRGVFNGFVARFHRLAKEAYFDPALRETCYQLVVALQADLDRWLVHYHTERPRLGYRNLGKRPLAIINAYLLVTRKAS